MPLSPTRFALFIPMLMLLSACCLCLPAEATAKSASQSDEPEYSRLFEAAREQRNQGNWRMALATISRIYQTEVPVQAFYDTLEREKLAILSSLSEDTIIAAGEHCFRLAELIQFFNRVLLPRADLLYHQMDYGHELPLGRLLYLYAVMGKAPKETDADPLLSPAAPEVDLMEATSSMDPWLVSGALFLARKGMGEFSPSRIIRRWSDRPDLWDDICTEQALMLLACLKPEQLQSLKPKRSDIADLIRRLTPIPADQPARAKVLTFLGESLELAKNDYLTASDCGHINLHGASQGKIPGDWCKNGLVTLPPGIYMINYRNTLMRGYSASFPMRNGAMTIVTIPVRGDI